MFCNISETHFRKLNFNSLTGHALAPRVGGLPRVRMDYCFLTEDVDKSSGDHGEAEVQRAGSSITVAVMQESLCKSVWAYAVDTKGSMEE